jgi:hypothetical protein
MIPPLPSVKADGTPYEREDNVLDCIARNTGVPEPIRIAEVPRMPSEALTFFSRHTDRSSREFWERVFRELIRRAGYIIYQTFRGLDEPGATDLMLQVEARVMEMIVKPKPSPAYDLFEIRFVQAVEMVALGALRVHLRSPLGALRGRAATQLDDDGDEIPFEVLLEGGAGPHDLLLVLRDRKRRHRLLRMACQAVPDRRHLRAAILRWGYDWPITAKNPDERCLTRHFGVSKRHMLRWLAGAMNAMTAALANEPEMREAKQQQLREVMREAVAKGGRR